MRLLLIITILVIVPFSSSSPLHKPDQLITPDSKEMPPSTDLISREASSEKFIRGLINDDEMSENTPDVDKMKPSTKVELLKNGHALFIQRSTKHKQNHANLIPLRDIKVKDNQKVIHSTFSDKKKRTKVDPIRNKTQVINNYSINSHLSSKDLQINDDFQSVRPKYINDGVKSLPPFPELAHETMAHDLSNPNGDSSISNQDDVSKLVWAVALSLSSDSQPTSRFVNSENGNSKSSGVHTKLIESEKFILSPKTESIFQSLQLRNYEQFEPIPPFPELHVPVQVSRGNSEGKNAPHQVVNDGKVPERAGPELYPASVFEKDLHVPFF